MFTSQQYDAKYLIQRMMYKVYGWMTFGLLTTMLTAVVAYHIEFFFINFVCRFLGLIIIAQLGLGFVISRYILSVKFKTALISYIIYTFLLGLSLSFIFAIYQLDSICRIFGVTGFMFGGMALYGYYTKADLSHFGNILMMGLIGIIAASIVNLFYASHTVDYVISLLGVAIFTGLVAWDVQTIKQYALIGYENQIDENNIAILGALNLYLDFINIFLYLLRLFGRRRD